MKTHRTPPLLCPKEVSASMTPHVYGTLSCLGVVGERSCWCLSEPRGLLFHTSVPQDSGLQLASWSAGLCLRQELWGKGHSFRGCPPVLLPWATLLRWRKVRRKGVTVSRSAKRRQAEKAWGQAGRSRSDFQFCPKTADCGPVTTLLWALFCSSVNWANSYINFILLLWGQNELSI